ncbi:putative AAA family ATPase [Rosellinia necatrix]|uniref:Putative AAA family ATPase n=1 Tax=Rosellinia necatrix TaxID=77044 RepID=A0A1S8ABA4_ROSNE|nr:putative AAA family ATPase [Rosellinia necatrix]
MDNIIVSPELTPSDRLVLKNLARDIQARQSRTGEALTAPAGIPSIRVSKPSKSVANAGQSTLSALGL